MVSLLSRRKSKEAKEAKEAAKEAAKGRSARASSFNGPTENGSGGKGGRKWRPRRKTEFARKLPQLDADGLRTETSLDESADTCGKSSPANAGFSIGEQVLHIKAIAQTNGSDDPWTLREGKVVSRHLDDLVRGVYYTVHFPATDHEVQTESDRLVALQSADAETIRRARTFAIDVSKAVKGARHILSSTAQSVSDQEADMKSRLATQALETLYGWACFPPPLPGREETIMSKSAQLVERVRSSYIDRALAEIRQVEGALLVLRAQLHEQLGTCDLALKDLRAAIRRGHEEARQLETQLLERRPELATLSPGNSSFSSSSSSSSSSLTSFRGERFPSPTGSYSSSSAANDSMYGSFASNSTGASTDSSNNPFDENFRRSTLTGRKSSNPFDDDFESGQETVESKAEESMQSLLEDSPFDGIVLTSGLATTQVNGAFGEEIAEEVDQYLQSLPEEPNYDYDYDDDYDSDDEEWVARV